MTRGKAHKYNDVSVARYESMPSLIPFLWNRNFRWVCVVVCVVRCWEGVQQGEAQSRCWGLVCSWLWTQQQEYKNHPMCGLHISACVPMIIKYLIPPKRRDLVMTILNVYWRTLPFQCILFEGHLSVTWLKLVALLAVLGMKARVSYRLRTSHPPSYIPILSLSALSWHAQGPFPLMVRCLAKLICIISACLPYFLPFGHKHFFVG